MVNEFRTSAEFLEVKIKFPPKFESLMASDFPIPEDAPVIQMS
jgi:hypothetical protein